MIFFFSPKEPRLVLITQTTNKNNEKWLNQEKVQCFLPIKHVNWTKNGSFCDKEKKKNGNFAAEIVLKNRQLEKSTWDAYKASLETSQNVTNKHYY